MRKAMLTMRYNQGQLKKNIVGQQEKLFQQLHNFIECVDARINPISLFGIFRGVSRQA